MSETIENLLSEERSFPPPADFARHANAQASIYEQAARDPLAFWEREAEKLAWRKPWSAVLDESDPPFYRWFTGGRLNVTESCLDRHLEEHGAKVAYHWEGEPGDTRTITFAELHREVCRLANALRSLGVKKGDAVAIYLGMVPELPIAMLACARIGAPHSVVFGGFSSDSLEERLRDAGCVAVITADGAWRRGKVVPLKENVDRAVARTPSVEHVIVVRRAENTVEWHEPRDRWYHELVEGAAEECEPEIMDAEDVLYILYTSGSTGKPKGIVHTTGGYLTGVAATQRAVFDIKPDDVY
ncbi:MAG: AMP-binding protein, partial [Planctomycetota bacterium]